MIAAAADDSAQQSKASESDNFELLTPHEQGDEDEDEEQQQQPAKERIGNCRGRLPKDGQCEASQYLRRVAEEALLIDSGSGRRAAAAAGAACCHDDEKAAKRVIGLSGEQQRQQRCYPSSIPKARDIVGKKIVSESIRHIYNELDRQLIESWLRNFTNDSEMIHKFQLHLAEYDSQIAPSSKSKFNLNLTIDQIDSYDRHELKELLAKLNQLHLADFMQHLYNEIHCALTSISGLESITENILQCIYSVCTCARRPHSAKLINFLRKILALLSCKFSDQVLQQQQQQQQEIRMQFLNILTVVIEAFEQDDIL